MNNQWTRHNHQQPCPVCGESKRGCRTNTSTNITHCRGDHPSPAYRFLKEDKHGFGMYRLEAEIEEFSKQKKEEWLEQKQRERERWLEAENQKIKDSLDNEERDRAIRTILTQLSLSTEDKERLHARGLSNKQIDEAGYRSVVQWQKLEEAVSTALAGVNRIGKGLNNSVSGVLVPVPNLYGQYVALRLHDPNASETGDGKYVWLSSKKQGCTQKDKATGEYPIAVYYPSEIREENKVGIVEGLEFKPKLAAERLGYPVIGVAGVSFFPNSPTLLKEALETLGVGEFVFIPDAGAVANQRVIQPSLELFSLIQEWDYNLSIAWWNQIEKSNGDIDEINPDTEIKLISLDDFKSHFNFGKERDRASSGGNYQDDEEKIKRLTKLTNIDKEINRQYFHPSDLDDVPNGCNLIFLVGHQGTGKSVLAKEEAKKARNDGNASYGITHRRLLSRSMARQWEIPFVEDTNGCRSKDGFTFVINSMHLESQAAFSPDDERLKGSTIVFDEFDQMLDELFNASTMENKRCLILENLTKTITNIVRSGGRCIFASADLYDFHREFVEGIFKEILNFIPKTFTIRNNYNPVIENDCDLLFYNHQEKDKTPAGIYADVVSAIAEGKKIFLQTTSQQVTSPYGTRTMEADLKKQFPELKILRWDSETNNDPTHPAFGLAEKLKENPDYLDQFDVVLISPVGETGLSFDDKNGHFDINPCIFNSGDQDTRTIKQTLRRLRPLVERWVYVAPRSTRKIGSGKKSPRGILRDNNKQLQKLKGELLTARIIDKADEFDFSEDSMLFLRPWSFSAALKNIDFANYRDRALAALNDVGYVIETTQSFPAFSIGYDATNDRVKAIRDDEKETHCNAVLEANDPDDERYQQLQKQNDKTPEERLSYEKGFITRAYAVEPKYDLIEKHISDQKWLQKLKLHYHITVGKDFINEKEKKRLESLLEGNGKIFGPEAVARSRLLKIYWLKEFGVDLFLEGSQEFTQGINSEKTITADELNTWYESVVSRDKQLKTALGISIWEKTDDGYQQIKPKTLADRLLKLLDLSLGSDRRRGEDGERHYIYHVRRTAKRKEANLLPLKSEIFQAWLETDIDKDREAQEVQEARQARQARDEERNHNHPVTVQKSSYSLNPYSKISGQDEISGQDSQWEDTGSDFDPWELAALIVSCDSEQLKRLRTQYYTAEQINQAWRLLTAEEKETVHRATREAS